MKTRVGLRIIQRVDVKNLSTIVVVPTLKLKKQWEEQITQWKFKYVKVYVINSYVKEQHDCCLLIVDECHWILSNESQYFSKTINLTNHKYFLGLSATLTNEQEELLKSYNKQLAYKATIRDALSNGWISDYLEYNLRISFNEYDREIYNKINKQFTYYFAYFNHNFDDAMGCLNRNYAEDWMLRYNKTNAQFSAIQFNRAMQARKKFLYKASCKLEVVKQIIDLFPDRKAIVFSESTEFADAVEDLLGDICVAYHSNLPTKVIGVKKYGKKKRQELALKKLEDGRTKVRVISTASALNEGYDYPDLSLGIIASGTSTERVQTQRIGQAAFYLLNSVKPKYL